MTPGAGRLYNNEDMDQDNASLEIRKVKNSIFKFGRDPDIETHKYEGGVTYRGMLTRNGQVSVLGWKLIRLALMGKSWRYMAKVTGASHENIAHHFYHNPVIRAAVLEMEKQLVEDSKALLVRSLRSVTTNLIKIAKGDIRGSKVQMSAILEVYNRIGFSMPVRGGQGQGGNVVIRLESGEAKDLALLVRDRQDRQLAPPDDDIEEEGGEESGQSEVEVGDEGDTGGEEEQGPVEYRFVADNGAEDNES